MLSKQRHEQSLSHLWMESWITEKGRGIPECELVCFLYLLWADRPSLMSRSGSISSAGIIGYGCSKTHTVTSSYHSIHLWVQTPLLRSKCGGVSSPLQMVSFQRARGPLYLLESRGGRISWVAVLHKMFCLSVLIILQGGERQEPPTETVLQGAYLLWTITSCSFYRLCLICLIHCMISGDASYMDSNKRLVFSDIKGVHHWNVAFF